MQPLARCLALLLCTAVPERPDDEPVPPARSAPRFLTVDRVDVAAGTIALTETTTVMLPVPEAVENGVPTRIANRAEKVTTVSQFPLKGVKLETAARQKFEGGELIARLRKGTTVLVSTDGQPLDPAYLKLLSPATLILVGPPAAVVGPPPPPIQPPPPGANPRPE